MLSLSALASWETVTLASIHGADGTIEERDAQITRSGMYAEYPAIFATYLELAQLASDAPTALEALKRAVFLAWCCFTSPSVFTGIAELPESLVREVMGLLDRAILDGRVDDELRAMVGWYRGQFDAVFELFGPVRRLDEFIGILDVDDASARVAAAQNREPRRGDSRGQMGAYWSQLASR